MPTRNRLSHPARLDSGSENSHIYNVIRNVTKTFYATIAERQREVYIIWLMDSGEEDLKRMYISVFNLRNTQEQRVT